MAALISCDLGQIHSFGMRAALGRVQRGAAWRADNGLLGLLRSSGAALALEPAGPVVGGPWEHALVDRERSYGRCY